MHNCSDTTKYKNSKCKMQYCFTKHHNQAVLSTQYKMPYSPDVAKANAVKSICCVLIKEHGVLQKVDYFFAVM